MFVKNYQLFSYCSSLSESNMVKVGGKTVDPIEDINDLVSDILDCVDVVHLNSECIFDIIKYIFHWAINWVVWCSEKVAMAVSSNQLKYHGMFVCREVVHHEASLSARSKSVANCLDDLSDESIEMVDTSSRSLFNVGKSINRSIGVATGDAKIATKTVSLHSLVYGPESTPRSPMTASA